MSAAIFDQTVSVSITLTDGRSLVVRFVQARSFEAEAAIDPIRQFTSEVVIEEVALSGPHAAMADAVMSAIRGGTDGQRLLHDLSGGCAGPDALHDALQAVLATNDEARLRGFARELQKALEVVRS